MNKPIISIVLPIYNGGKTLRRALDSVVNQSIFDRCELILINDCSRDNSQSIAKTYCSKFSNIRYINNPQNQGITKNHIMALELSKGKYIARIDQDDEWIDNKKLEKQYKFLEDNLDYGLVGTWAKVINSDGRDFILAPPENDHRIRQKFLTASMFVSPSVMFRKELSKQIGTYQDIWKYGTEDYEYWLRIGTVSKLANIPEYCIAYSFHLSSYSVANKAEAIKEHLDIIKSYRKNYPGFTWAYFKNSVEYYLLKIGFLKKIYIKLVPLAARIIYHD